MRLPHVSKVFWTVVIAIFIAASASAEPWKFGVVGDTQWAAPDDGKNPNGVPLAIITQINDQFIRAGVRLVVQVGDLFEADSQAALETRARAAQDLCSAGIAFYPLRGNHHSTQDAAQGFQIMFPQTQGNGPCVHGARNFTSPSRNLTGLSYAFDYNNTRFVLLDQFTRTDGSGKDTDNNIADQLDWVETTLVRRPANGHVFVFSHKNLIGEYHHDVLFGSDPAQNQEAQERFMRSLKTHGVHYYISGHDHIHQRSVIKSPGGTCTVQQIITASASSKFYIPQGSTELPGTTNNDARYNKPPREISLAQEANTIGYYVCTVDGPRVTVDYYSAAVNPSRVRNAYVIDRTPTLQFTRRESFGYSLNGKEFLIGRDMPYTNVQDKSPFSTTRAKILGGCNRSANDGSDRPLSKSVATGWERGTHAASDILTLWGMERGMGSKETDVYALSMTYDRQRAMKKSLRQGLFGLATMDEKGYWVNAVEENLGGKKRFVCGPWQPGYMLGTYGVDPRTQIAWATINHGGIFSVRYFDALR